MFSRTPAAMAELRETISNQQDEIFTFSQTNKVLQQRIAELEAESRRLGEALDFHTDDIVPKLKAENEALQQRIAELEKILTETESHDELMARRGQEQSDE